MKIFFVTVFTLFTSLALGSELETIKYQFDSSRSEYINLADAVGGYEGLCYEGSSYQFEQKEALYVGRFENSKGDITYLPFATEHLFNNSTQPEFVAALTDTSIRKNWTKINATIKAGHTGADNNLGELNKGSDFTYLYSTENDLEGVKLKVSRYSDCRPGQFCSPPELPRCETYYEAGLARFTGCSLSNDATHFKKISDTVLVSKRSASGWGENGNNFTIKVSAASYCRWTRVLPKASVPKRFH